MNEIEYPYLKEIKLLIETGINTSDCVGYHGTSIETVLRLAQQGTIPGTKVSYSNPNLPQRGDVYFLPDPETFPFDLIPDIRDERHQSSQKVIKDIIKFASYRAPSHFFLDRLGLDIGQYSSEASTLIVEFPSKLPNGKNWWEDHFQLFRSLGVPDAKIIETIQESKKRCGVVIGLKESALKTYPPTPGDYGNDFRVSPGERGLSYNFMSGIKLIGEQEREIFENLTNLDTN